MFIVDFTNWAGLNKIQVVKCGKLKSEQIYAGKPRCVTQWNSDSDSVLHCCILQVYYCFKQ